MKTARIIALYMKLLKDNLGCQGVLFGRHALGEMLSTPNRINRDILEQCRNVLTREMGIDASIVYERTGGKFKTSGFRIGDSSDNEVNYLPTIIEMKRILENVVSGISPITDIQIGRTDHDKELNTVLLFMTHCMSCNKTITYPHGYQLHLEARKPNGNWWLEYSNGNHAVHINVPNEMIVSVCTTIHNQYNLVRNGVSYHGTDYDFLYENEISKTILELLYKDPTLFFDGDRLNAAYTTATAISKPTVTVNIKRQSKPYVPNFIMVDMNRKTA